MYRNAKAFQELMDFTYRKALEPRKGRRMDGMLDECFFAQKD